MGDVPKNLMHSGDGSPLVHLGSRGYRPRQKHLRGLEQKHTDLGELHLHGSGPARRSNRRFFCGPARYSTVDRHVTPLQKHLCVEPEAAAGACRSFSSSNSGAATQTGNTGLGLARTTHKERGATCQARSKCCRDRESAHRCYDGVPAVQHCRLGPHRPNGVAARHLPGAR